MSIFKSLVIVSLALGLVQVANADTSNMEKMHAEHQRSMMQDADTNKDGVISREEFMAAHQAQAEKMFDKLDTNHDGKIDQAERKSGREMMQKNCNMKDHNMHTLDQDKNSK